jgi:ATP-dependent DNA helicase RecQ
VPPFVITSDSVLVELSRVRPTSLTFLKRVRGIGDKKLADFGDAIVKLIADFCGEHHIATDIAPAKLPTIAARPIADAAASKVNRSEARALAFKLFAEGWKLDDVKHKIERARSTTIEYLAEYIASEHPSSLEPWVAAPLYKRIAAAIEGVQKHAPDEEAWRLQPIFAALDGEVPYDDIRLVVSHLKSRAMSQSILNAPL